MVTTWRRHPTAPLRPHATTAIPSRASTLKTRANLNHNWQIVKSLFIKVA
jgi:hypothetical protein